MRRQKGNLINEQGNLLVIFQQLDQLKCKTIKNKKTQIFGKTFIYLLRQFKHLQKKN